MKQIKTSLQKTDDYFMSLSKGTCNDCALQKADNFFKKAAQNLKKDNTQNTKTYDMGHGQKLTVDISKPTHSHSNGIVKTSNHNETGFWKYR